MGLAWAWASVLGCQTAPDDGSAGPCGGMPCEVAADRDELLQTLSGLGDPMAAVLRERAGPDATIEGGWEAVLDGLGAQVGCDASTERSFVVLSNVELRPKGILTRCSDSPIDASTFFMIFEPDVAAGDLAGDAFRVTAWDEDAQRYRRYQMVPTETEDALAVAVEPQFCASCHGGTQLRAPWTPIMNEMTEPWAQWNAEPGFSSYLFDEVFPEGAAGPIYDAVADDARLDSASNLEPIVRSAYSRVSAARVEPRDAAPDLDVALDMLRPVFCDETVNFVSEIHDSGEINLGAVLDQGLREAFAALDDGAGAWVSDTNLRIASPSADEPRLSLVAIRGHASVAAERALRSRGVLSAHQILAVRALDWTHPFASSLRCGLLGDAEARARDGAVDVAAQPDNAALVARLYDEAMRGLTTATDTTVLAIADADDPAAAAALAHGELSSYELQLPALGQQIADHVESFASPDARARLLAERNRRACLAKARYPTAPIIADLPACP